MIEGVGFSRMAKVIQQAFECACSISGIGMQFIQLDFHKAFSLEQEAPRQTQYVFRQAQRTEMGERRARQHPRV